MRQMASRMRAMRRVTAGLVLVGAFGMAYLVLPARGSFDVRTSGSVAGTSEIVYATGDRLFISGDEFAIEPAPDSLALTQGGLYFLADENLHLWEPDGSTQLAAIGGFQPLRTTADGRYLGFVDRRNGPMNLARERIAEFVVIDTRTGREVVRDGVGNGDRWGTDDTGALYSEQPPAFLGFDDRHAYGQTSGRDLYRWHLTTGDRADVPEPEFPDVPPPRTPNAPGGELVSFDRSGKRLVVADHPEAGSYPGRVSPDRRHLAFVIGGDQPAVIRLGLERPAPTRGLADGAPVPWPPVRAHRLARRPPSRRPPIRRAEPAAPRRARPGRLLRPPQERVPGRERRGRVHRTGDPGAGRRRPVLT